MVPVGAVTTDGLGGPAVTYPGDNNPGTVPQANGPFGAPGVNGVIGSMAKSVVPSHYHIHNHTHKFGQSSGGVDDTNVAQVPDGGGAFSVNTSASGSGFVVALVHHTHNLLAEYISVPRDPTNAGMRDKDISGTDPSATNLTQTSVQALQTAGSNTAPAGGTAGDSLSMDARPASRGFIFIMKVRHSPA